MANHVIADKRTLFGLLTQILDRGKKDKDNELVMLVDAATELWTKTMIEEHEHDERCLHNVHSMQARCRDWLKELYQHLQLMGNTMQEHNKCPGIISGLRNQVLDLERGLASKDGEMARMKEELEFVHGELSRMDSARAEAVRRLQEDKGAWDKARRDLESQLESLAAELEDGKGEMEKIQVKAARAQRSSQKMVEESESRNRDHRERMAERLAGKVLGKSGREEFEAWRAATAESVRDRKVSWMVYSATTSLNEAQEALAAKDAEMRRLEQELGALRQEHMPCADEIGGLRKDLFSLSLPRSRTPISGNHLTGNAVSPSKPAALPLPDDAAGLSLHLHQSLMVRACLIIFCLAVSSALLLRILPPGPASLSTPLGRGHPPTGTSQGRWSLPRAARAVGWRSPPQPVLIAVLSTRVCSYVPDELELGSISQVRQDCNPQS